MKITIEHFGPINKFEFDLDKDLHLLYGENSVGKSYGLYVVYSLLKVFSIQKGKFFHHGPGDLEKESTLYLSTRNAPENDKGFVSIVEPNVLWFLNQNYSNELNTVFRSTFPKLADLDNQFSGQPLSIEITTVHSRLTIQKNEKSNLVISKFEVLSTLKRKAKEGGDIQILLGENVIWGSHKKEIPSSITLELFYSLFIEEFESSISSFYFLPASRSGLYQSLNSLSPILVKLSLQRNAQDERIELPSLSAPVADYFLNLSEISSNSPNPEFAEIVQEVEEQILKGKVEFNNENKRVIYRPNNTSLELDLSSSSSMVAELSLIIAHLKYIIPSEGKDGNPSPPILLIIEEPEAHLHPKVQVQLVEFFASLIKYNVKIILSSHSNYMFNKLNNLLLSQKVSPEKVAVYHMIMTPKGSIVSDDMKVDEDGIDDHNFVDVAEELYRERFEILHDQEEEPNNE